jgi:hypothetical protein
MSRSQRVEINLSLNQRSAPGSGCQASKLGEATAPLAMPKFVILSCHVGSSSEAASFVVKPISGELQVGDSFVCYDTHHPAPFLVTDLQTVSDGLRIVCSGRLGFDDQFSGATVDTALLGRAGFKYLSPVPDSSAAGYTLLDLLIVMSGIVPAVFVSSYVPAEWRSITQPLLMFVFGISPWCCIFLWILPYRRRRSNRHE